MVQPNKGENKDSPIFVLRDLEVVKHERDAKLVIRNFKHFHYIAWPDFGVPDTPDEFAKFFDLLEEQRCFSNPSSPRYEEIQLI